VAGWAAWRHSAWCWMTQMRCRSPEAATRVAIIVLQRYRRGEVFAGFLLEKARKYFAQL
jgi:hypothetical protein